MVQEGNDEEDEDHINVLSKDRSCMVWGAPDQRPRTHQTCVIFDWDDTILCTSFLTPYPSMLMDPRQ